MSRSSTEVPARRFVRKRELCREFDVGPSFVASLVRAGRLTPHRVTARMTLYDPEQMGAVVADAAVRAPSPKAEHANEVVA